jgi:hypothetical protein
MLVVWFELTSSFAFGVFLHTDTHPTMMDKLIMWQLQALTHRLFASGSQVVTGCTSSPYISFLQQALYFTVILDSQALCISLKENNQSPRTMGRTLKVLRNYEATYTTPDRLGSHRRLPDFWPKRLFYLSASVEAP